MKANRLFLSAIAAVALLSSCSKDFFFEDVKDNSIQMSHYDYSVRSSDWELATSNEGGYYLFTTLSVPEITRNVVNNGTVTVSWGQKGDDGNTIWTPLPAVRAHVMDYDTENEYLYSTYLDYDWTVGSVYVYLTATDLFVEDESEWPSLKLRVTILN